LLGGQNRNFGKVRGLKLQLSQKYIDEKKISEKIRKRKQKNIIIRVNYTPLPSKMLELHSHPLLC